MQVVEGGRADNTGGVGEQEKKHTYIYIYEEIRPSLTHRTQVVEGGRVANNTGGVGEQEYVAPLVRG